MHLYCNKQVWPGQCVLGGRSVGITGACDLLHFVLGVRAEARARPPGTLPQLRFIPGAVEVVQPHQRPVFRGERHVNGSLGRAAADALAHHILVGAGPAVAPHHAPLPLHEDPHVALTRVRSVVQHQPFLVCVRRSSVHPFISHSVHSHLFIHSFIHSYKHSFVHESTKHPFIPIHPSIQPPVSPFIHIHPSSHSFTPHPSVHDSHISKNLSQMLAQMVMINVPVLSGTYV